MNTKHIGNLQINSAADAKRYAHIEEVTGYLGVSADFQAPVLATVGGSDITMRPIWFGGLEYSVTILDSTMRIGCQEHLLCDWEAFDNSQIAEMDGPKAVRFWAENKSKLIEFAAANGRVIE